MIVVFCEPTACHRPSRFTPTPTIHRNHPVVLIVFAALDLVAAVRLLVFVPVFGPDTPETRRRAPTVMRGMFALVLLIGLAFLYVAFSAPPVQSRIAVQALIFSALGLGGL